MTFEPSSGPRMRLLINLFEPFDARVSVYLRRRHRRVSQELLHGPQIRPGVEEVRGESVAKGMDRQPRFLVDFPEKAAHHLLHRPDADSLACSRDEDSLTIHSDAERIAFGLVIPKGERRVIA